jgi:NAD(P)-dependent dehydrogenase (short-subunit alcohol dehydrogenase family)
VTAAPRSPRATLITGAGGGLGAAIALRFAAAGHPVVCLDLDDTAVRRTEVAVLESLPDPAPDTGARVSAHRVDVTDESALAALRETLAERDLRPRHVINAAGILTRGQLASTDAATFHRVLEVNVTGAYAVTRVFRPDLVAAGATGRLINIASIAGIGGYPFPAYAASKAGLINLTRALVLDFWGTGVTANAVCPGAMDTPMLDRSALAAFRRKTPTGRVVNPAEVAGICAFLVSPDAAAVNGQALVVDGGATSVFRYTDDHAERHTDEEAG